MNDLADRSAIVTIGGVDYPLIVTTKATKEIAKRCGGMEALGDKLMHSENMEDALTEVVWIITLLANQAILIHNFRNKDNPKPILTEDEVELMTTPSDMFGFKEAITEAMLKGTKRNVESESDEAGSEKKESA